MDNMENGVLEHLRADHAGLTGIYNDIGRYQFGMGSIDELAAGHERDVSSLDGDSMNTHKHLEHRNERRLELAI